MQPVPFSEAAPTLPPPVLKVDVFRVVGEENSPGGWEGSGPGSPHPHPISTNWGAMTTSTKDAFVPRLSRQLSQTRNEANV